jgi:hypothetical protein
MSNDMEASVRISSTRGHGVVGIEKAQHTPHNTVVPSWDNMSLYL